MSVFVVRAFIRLRDVARQSAQFSDALAELQKRVSRHDRDLQALLRALSALAEPVSKDRRRIGFRGGNLTEL